VGRGGGGAALITLTTDFGTADPFVGIMKGVIATRAPGVPVVDLSNDVAPQDVLGGARVLEAALPYFPRGTVHVAVVDPGVGTTRRPIVVETSDGYLVGPDNGVLSLAASPDRIRRVVDVDYAPVALSPRSATFHGRDVFAPVAAALASGIALDRLGTSCNDMVRLDVPACREDGPLLYGVVVGLDRFGNLATNIPETALKTVRTIEIAGRVLPGLTPTYGVAGPGALVAVVNSTGVLEIAVRNGNASAVLGVGVGTPVLVTRN
jgi:hypothetical protein